MNRHSALLDMLRIIQDGNEGPMIDSKVIKVLHSVHCYLSDIQSSSSRFMTEIDIVDRARSNKFVTHIRNKTDVTFRGLWFMYLMTLPDTITGFKRIYKREDISFYIFRTHSNQ